MQTMYLMHPPKAKGYTDLQKKLLEWDITLAEECKKSATGEVLNDRVKAMSLIWMMPESLEEEIMKNPRAIRENYYELQTLVEDAIYNHTAGISTKSVNPVIAHMDAGLRNQDSDIEMDPHITRSLERPKCLPSIAKNGRL